MGVQERRAREKQELRQEILCAARDLFVREGFENVSMRKIAERIEYSPTTIYLYFEDKIGLIDTLCEETLLSMEERLIAIRQRYPDPLEKITRGLRDYIEFGVEHPNDYRLSFMMEFKELHESGRNLKCHEIGQRLYQAFRDDVAECIETGAFAPRDPEASSQAIWSGIHGLVCLLITRPNFPWVDRDALIETLVETTVAGFKVPAHSPVG